MKLVVGSIRMYQEDAFYGTRVVMSTLSALARFRGGVTIYDPMNNVSDEWKIVYSKKLVDAAVWGGMMLQFEEHGGLGAGQRLETKMALAACVPIRHVQIPPQV